MKQINKPHTSGSWCSRFKVRWSRNI